MALRNMGCQNKELCRRLKDTEKLQLNAKAATFEHRALEESPGKGRSRSRYWELKAKDGFEKTKGAEKERDKDKEEAQVTRLEAVIVGDAKEKMEGDLAKVKDALAATKEARKVVEEARRKA